MKHPAREYNFDDLVSRLNSAVDRKHVRCVSEGPLRLYNYSDSCVYEKAWCPITMMARGLILDIDAKEIVATPFQKFFNLHERPDELPDLPFECFEKLDGSLIILFHHDGQWKTATRGSLSSVQSLWAAEWIKGLNLSYLKPGTTYLAEVIYPQNRIVVSYDREGLILLSAFDSDGFELPYDVVSSTADALGWEIANRYEYSCIKELCERASKLSSNEEGFVLRFKNGHRVKIKGDEYCRIHRLISRVTPLSVWESMMAGDNLEMWRKELPEEFWVDFDTIWGLINEKFVNLKIKIMYEADKVSRMTDKEVGLSLLSIPEEVRPFIFSYRKRGFEDRRLREGMFKSFRPTGNLLSGYRPSSAINLVQEAS